MKKVVFIIVTIFLISFFICVEAVIKNDDSDSIIIFLDPGHGGRDGGAIGADGTYEKTITLSIALKLKDMFHNAGFKVLMTRDSDYDLASDKSKNQKRDDIHKRVEMINESNADFYLSIHANSFPSPKEYGAQTFYKANESLSRDLAVCIQEAIILNLFNTKRVVKDISNVYLIDNVKIPGVLVEVGFLSNQEELRLLTDENYHYQMAKAIYLGTCEYLQKNYKE